MITCAIQLPQLRVLMKIQSSLASVKATQLLLGYTPSFAQQPLSSKEREFLPWLSVLSSEQGGRLATLKPDFKLWLWEFLDHSSFKFSKHFILL